MFPACSKPVRHRDSARIFRPDPHRHRSLRPTFPTAAGDRDDAGSSRIQRWLSLSRRSRSARLRSFASRASCRSLRRRSGPPIGNTVCSPRSSTLVLDQGDDRSPHRDSAAVALRLPRRPQRLGDRHPDHLVAFVVAEAGEKSAINLGQGTTVRIQQASPVYMYTSATVLHVRGALRGVRTEAVDKAR